MKIGQHINTWRVEAGLSQDAIKSRLGIMPASQRRIEKGITDPLWSTVQKYAIAARETPTGSASSRLLESIAEEES